jgi:hypothetical protein
MTVVSCVLRPQVICAHLCTLSWCSGVFPTTFASYQQALFFLPLVDAATKLETQPICTLVVAAVVVAVPAGAAPLDVAAV